MIATTLESNGAIVYITGRRADALEKAVKERSVSGLHIPSHDESFDVYLLDYGCRRGET